MTILNAVKSVMMKCGVAVVLAKGNTLRRMINAVVAVITKGGAVVILT